MTTPFQWSGYPPKYDDNVSCLLGNLSDSYIAEVTYRTDSGTDWEGLSVESWFIKVLQKRL